MIRLPSGTPATRRLLVAVVEVAERTAARKAERLRAEAALARRRVRYASNKRADATLQIAPAGEHTIGDCQVMHSTSSYRGGQAA